MKLATRTTFIFFLTGRMGKSGGPELADVLEARGYDWVKKEALN